jgi:hypothetical protein
VGGWVGGVTPWRTTWGVTAAAPVINSCNIIVTLLLWLPGAAWAGAGRLQIAYLAT